VVATTPPTITVGLGDYRGSTSQLRPILIQVREPNTIWQGGLTFSAICAVEDLSITATVPIAISNGAFSHTSPFTVLDSVFGTDGTYTVTGAFNPATSTFSGSLVVAIGSCNTGPLTYTAPKVQF
jgi:hypothetical protein